MTVKGMTKNGDRNYQVEATFSRGTRRPPAVLNDMMKQPEFQTARRQGAPRLRFKRLQRRGRQRKTNANTP